MPIFEVGDDAMVALEQTTFAEAGLKERSDLQRLLRQQIEVIDPDVLVIAEEFGDWTDSRRRIDLLGIDKNANLVVIELKRTEDGGHMELQALRYAAMVSALTAERAVEVFGAYLESQGKEADPEQLILDFLDWTDIDGDEFGQEVRIVLVSGDFSRELTTAVIWLNEKDLDIRCVRMRPYTYNGQTLVDVQHILPLQEAADYQVQVREKRREERAARRSNRDFTRYDIVIDGETYTEQWKRNSILLVVKAIVEAGVDVRELKVIFGGFGRMRAFYEIPVETTDPSEFCRLARELGIEKGRAFKESRWHTGEGDLFPGDGSTFVFSNQWGQQWPTFMEQLKKRYPQVELEYYPSNSQKDDD
jgi:hypothetical protein